jgi:hypothetical protein
MARPSHVAQCEYVGIVVPHSMEAPGGSDDPKKIEQRPERVCSYSLPQPCLAAGDLDILGAVHLKMRHFALPAAQVSMSCQTACSREPEFVSGCPRWAETVLKANDIVHDFVRRDND